MAAPSGTVWGSIVGGYGRIGIHVSLSNISNTETKRTTTIWFWSKYSVSDTSNTIYYNDNASSATTGHGSVSIKTTVDSGGGWSTSNQVQIYSATYTFTRGTSDSKKNVAAKLVGIDRVGGTMTCTTSYTVPKKPSYTVSYNANGGSGAPGSQTKWYGTNLTLSSTRPSRTGYTFAGWATSSSGSVAYQPGGTYSSNASVTLYAKWTANTYKVSFNPNGGTGGPSYQTKTYGVNLTLSTSKPTRTNYNFVGWGTSASSTSASYQPGGTYTANSAITLYAIWSLAYKLPRLSGFSAQRCNSSGTTSESGTYLKVSFSWSTDRSVSAIYIQWRSQSTSTWTSAAVSASGTSGSVSQVVGSNGISTESSYYVRAYVQDSGGTTYSSQSSIGTVKFPIDVKSGGTGIAFGKVAENANLADFGWPVRFTQKFNSQILSGYGGTSWISGRNVALIRNPVSTGSLWGALTSSKTNNGTFETGTIFDEYTISYASDTNYNNGTNDTKRFVFASTGNMTVPGALTVGSSLSANGGIYGALRGSDSSVAGGFRFTNEWIGLYANQTNAINQSSRKGWIGHNGSTDLNITNETGGIVKTNADFWAPNFRINNSAGGSLAAYFADGALHDLTSIASDRLTLYFGGASGISSSQLTNLRGYKVHIYTHGGAITSSRSISVSSDRNFKYDIKNLDEKYEKFYMDLSSKTFKYKNNNFDRIHTGFIAQDVEEALNKNGLTTNDFAGLVIDDSFIDPEGDGTSEERYFLRYEEFISLNTHMIQKANKKIKAQQQIINEQQKEIEELKNQVKELKDLILNLSNKGG